MMTGPPAAIAAEPTLPAVRGAQGWLAVVWAPDAAAVARLAADAEVRRALTDHGPYAPADHFDLLVTGAGTPPDGIGALGGRVGAWRTEVHVVRAAEAILPLTMVSFPRRRADLTRAEFADHWTERHAPLALQHHVGLADYRQHVVVEPLTDASADVDGIALLGFPSREDFATRFYDSDAGKAAIRADVARFIAPLPPGEAGTTTLVGPAEPRGADR
jgi:uncharacterized protein (TIGR02118 family)